MSVSLPEELRQELERVEKDTGVSMSTQIELRLRGYKIVKVDDYNGPG